jgi:thioredoxin 1
MAAIDINQKQFEQMIHGDKPVLVDYWAPWCGYCRRIGPAYEEIAQEFGDRIEVVKINIDEEGQLAQAEQVNIIPTLTLYKNGKAVDSVVNPGSKAAIEQFIQEALAK